MARPASSANAASAAAEYAVSCESRLPFLSFSIERCEAMSRLGQWRPVRRSSHPRVAQCGTVTRSQPPSTAWSADGSSVRKGGARVRQGSTESHRMSRAASWPRGGRLAKKRAIGAHLRRSSRCEAPYRDARGTMSRHHKCDTTLVSTHSTVPSAGHGIRPAWPEPTHRLRRAEPRTWPRPARPHRK